MIILYRLFFLPIFLCILPYYLKRMLKRGGYAHNFLDRFGFFDPIPSKKKGIKRIWIQAVSVGEANAIGPLIEKLSHLETVELILSCTTTTAYSLLEKRYAGKVLKIVFFPLDFWPCSYMAWEKINPDLMILTEGDLWPENAYQAYKRKTPLVLINGRISDKSFQRYKIFMQLTSKLFSKMAMIFTASQEDYERFLYLGASINNTFFCGNLKIEASPTIVLNTQQKDDLKKEMGFLDIHSTSHPLIIIGCSTWNGEEAILVDTLTKIQKKGHNVCLILVPRHPERRIEIKKLLDSQPIPWKFRSDYGNRSKVDIYVVDTIGELTHLAQIADIAFIGKSLHPHIGGQNPIDLSKLGIPIVYGPNMSNFKQVCLSLESIGAAIKIEKPPQLINTIEKMITDPSLRSKMSQSGSTWAYSHKHASQTILAHLACLLK